ncbi:hypothetical protein ACFS5J_09500 [Flavobacterium chuncheonense]|uniref:Uncharacterized protein n=1 Tax=Flavobacterium chuncheonense TaxID=2026653 RepID=A0ABW5YMR1_9FLAO
MKINKNIFYFYAFIGIILVLGVIFPFVLPQNFFNDAYVIVEDRFNEIGLIGSYPFTMSFYKYTGLKYLPFSIIALIQLPILYYLLRKIGIPKDFHMVTVKNLLVYLALLMIAIFIGMPSKEFITFIFIWYFVFIFLNHKKSISKKIRIGILLFLIFSFIFRPYFIFIPVIAIGMNLLSKVNIKDKVVSSVFTGLTIMVFMSISYGIVKGKHFSQQTREELNEERGMVDANSMLTSPIEPNTWYGETVSIVYGFFSVNLPVNGLKHFLKPQILVFIVWQFFLFYILLVRFYSLIKHKKELSAEYWLMLFLFAYFIIQGVFEPDLGSAVRHKIGVFPLIYYLLYYEDFRREVQ